MNKIFTLTFKYSIKLFMVAVMICSSSLLHPSIAYTTTLDKGIQMRTIRCYPNPAVSFINFEFPDVYISKDFSLQVFSFTGRKMYEMNITSAKATITFSNDFYRGIYIYQLKDKDSRIVETGKFQVN